jgi:hypothetical protein
MAGERFIPSMSCCRSRTHVGGCSRHWRAPCHTAVRCARECSCASTARHARRWRAFCTTVRWLVSALAPPPSRDSSAPVERDRSHLSSHGWSIQNVFFVWVSCWKLIQCSHGICIFCIGTPMPTLLENV